MDEKKLLNIEKIATILTSVSLVVGIIIGLIQLSETLNKANETMDAVKVESLSNVIKILDDNREIRVDQALFDAEKFRKALAIANTMLAANKTGEQIYYSKQLEDFRKIAAHYERMSALIDLGYLEFKVIYDVVTFPDNFWSGSRELRTQIKENWNGKGDRLKGFMSGFAKLCKSYKEARGKDGMEIAKQMVCE